MYRSLLPSSSRLPLKSVTRKASGYVIAFLKTILKKLEVASFRYIAIGLAMYVIKVLDRLNNVKASYCGNFKVIVKVNYFNIFFECLF